MAFGKIAAMRVGELRHKSAFHLIDTAGTVIVLSTVLHCRNFNAFNSVYFRFADYLHFGIFRALS